MAVVGMLVVTSSLNASSSLYEKRLREFRGKPVSGRSVKIRDLTEVIGEEGVKLTGFGVVSGLNGTGDKKRAAIDMLLRVAEKQGIRLDANEIEKGNTAIVSLSAEVNPHQKRFNVAVKSIGDSKSLQNGFLEASTLSPIGSSDVFAVAIGALSLGARYFSASAAGGTTGGTTSVTIGHPTMAYVLEGGELIKELKLQRIYDGKIELFVKYPNNRTATNIANSINEYLTILNVEAEPVSASRVSVKLPPSLYANMGDLTRIIADIGDLPSRVSRSAVITIDQGSGVIAMTEGVRMEPGSIAVAGLTVIVSSDITPVVRQAGTVVNAPSINQFGGTQSSQAATANLGSGAGETAFMDHPKLQVTQDKVNFLTLPAGTDLRKVQETFNALKLEPTSIISVFQAMHDAGMIHAEIVVMPK